MIISIAVEGCDGLGRILFPVVVDEGKTFALAGDLVLGEVDPSDATKRLEQFLQVSLLSVFRQVGDPDGGGVIG